MVRREGLEPSCLAASDPKSGASANSATFARSPRSAAFVEKSTYYSRVAVGHYENFPVASLLLPAPLRQPVEAIYRFARSADDLADEGSDPPQLRLERLDDYRAELARIEHAQRPRAALFQRLEKTIKDHALPLAPFYDLLDAFSQDVTKKRYASFDEVLGYCRRSANPVGRLLLHLFKRTTDSDLARSDAICTALQLINFWQDADLDFRRDDRVYLPQDEMASFGVNDEQIARQDAGGRWRELMAFQVERARAMMNEGAPLGRALGGRIGLELRMIVAGRSRILEKIENVGGNVFEHRPVLRPLDWPLMLARAARRRGS